MNRRRKVDQLHYELLTCAEARRGGSSRFELPNQSQWQIKLIKTTTRSHNPLNDERIAGRNGYSGARKENPSLLPMRESEREK
jgi:hypothetical protein